MKTEKGRMFSHGTLMYNVDLSVIGKALNVPADKIASKGIKSVHSRVTNLKPFFKPEFQNLTIEEFRDTLAKTILGVEDLNDAREYELDAKTKRDVEELNQSVFSNWDWIYGQSPKAAIQHRKHFPQGTVDFRLTIKDGRIATLTTYGDFFGQKPIEEFEKQLIGTRYERTAVKNVLDNIELSNYFGKISETDILDLLLRQE